MIVIRPSSLPGFADCQRRAIARSFPKEVKAAGYALRETPQGIGAAIGVAVHVGAAHMLEDKRRSGRLEQGAITMGEHAAEASLRESMREGITWDATSPRALESYKQTLRMVRSYAHQTAPKIEPVLVEERLEMTVAPGVLVSGQM